jgi:glycosyltransferase involved in cell wall biosynthesis
VDEAGEQPSLRIAMMGTRGVPARYGGFETAIEEIGRRLVERGHRVTVYCRRPPEAEPLPDEYLGMALRTLPALRSKSMETLSHSALSAGDAVLRGDEDVVFLFNAANSPFVPLLRLRRLPVAVHVDGLEWRRSKWTGLGKRYYRAAESLSVKWADALIADAHGIAEYYREEFGASCEEIAYGAPILSELPGDRLARLGLSSGEFHLVVARFEPENHVELIVRGFRSSSARRPLVVVGGAPYSDDYSEAVRAAAGDDERIQLVGPVWDQDELDQLYSHALHYLHGHSVGGTNPSLLRAMGAGAAVSAFDVGFNREVLGEGPRFFADAAQVAQCVDAAEADVSECGRLGEALRDRARERYRWDEVTAAYADLAVRLDRGWTRRGEASGRRRDAPSWRQS